VNTYYLAIDIGASSGRHILAHFEDGVIVLEEMHRFENRLLEHDGHLTWDIDHLWSGIVEGLKRCKEAGKIPVSIGIDTWAVDYVLLDAADNPAGDAVSYRDARTEQIGPKVWNRISEEELYRRTGIQKQLFNTIYQLAALQEEHPEQLEEAEALLMIPDYLNFMLTGVKKQEYTNATSTNMVNAQTKTWDPEIIKALGLPEKLFGELSMPGAEVGHLLPGIQKQVGFDAKVILPATHDTGSAFLAVPAEADGKSVYLSSGTWSLLGVENEEAITTEPSRQANFTNEGGAWYRYRYLKNIMGLWMIQSVRRELNGVSYVVNQESSTEQPAGQGAEEGKSRTPVLEGSESRQEWGFGDLAVEARLADAFPAQVDVNDNRFLAPESMIAEIKKACADTGQPVPETVGELMQCIYTSLATGYREAIRELQELTGKTYERIRIIGGGCQDSYLDEMTAKATGLPVYAGPIEGTAIGNLVVQMIADGAYATLEEAREGIRKSFDIRKFDI